MKRRLLLQLLLCTACTGVVAVLADNTTVDSRPEDLDYRYHDKDGMQKWCVYCMAVDWQKNFVESNCLKKPYMQLIEKHEWRGEMKDFWPLCGSLFTDDHYYRYIKNCTGPPTIQGATVNCTDQDGRHLYRVHDTCRVTCTTPRTRASDPITTCDPWTATWTPVTCQPDACPPLRSVIGQESVTPCDPNIDYPLNTMCDVQCKTLTGQDPTTRRMQCIDGQWKTVKPCPALSACPQLSSFIKEDERTLCNVSKWLPSNTTCEINCSEGYIPRSRVMLCSGTKWKVKRTCAPHQGVPMWMIGLYVLGGLILIAVICILVMFWIKCRHRSNTAEADKDTEAKSQAYPLITSPSGSMTTGSECQVSLATHTDTDETSFITDDTTSTGSKVVDEEDKERSRADDLPPPYSSHDVNEHNVAVVCPPSFNKGDHAALQACNKVEIFYKRNEEGSDHRLPESCEIQTSAGSQLTLYAVCGNLHRIIQFYFGPSFIGDEHESLETGVRLHVTQNTHGNYLLCAKCTQGGEVVIRVFIRVTDNPDETNLKRIYRREDDFDSLQSEETELNMSGGGEPSKELEAEPFSLPSNPSLGKELYSGSEEEEMEACRAVGGAKDRPVVGFRGGARTRGRPMLDDRGEVIEERGGAMDRTEIYNRLGPAVSNLSIASRCTQEDSEDDLVRECTLLLMDLQKHQYKKLLDKLCLKLEPLSNRESDRTIFGATLSILGFSVDRVEHVVWAKREDLRNTPARVLLSMMMQAGKRSGHLVRYFATEDCRHPDVVTILKRAHPDCPFCQNY